MSLWSKIKDVALGPPIKRKDDFVDRYIDDMLNDGKVKEVISKNPERYDEFKSGLTRIIGDNYDKYVADYAKGSVLTKYAAPLLRFAGLGMDLAGDTLFYIFPGAGLGFKTWSFYAKNAADSIEAAHYLYHNHDAYDFKKALPWIVGETAVSRAAAATPTFLGSMYDWWRGKRKLSTQAAKKALYNSIEDFLKQYNPAQVDQPVNIPGHDRPIGIPAPVPQPASAYPPMITIDDLTESNDYLAKPRKLAAKILPLRYFQNREYAPSMA